MRSNRERLNASSFYFRVIYKALYENKHNLHKGENYYEKIKVLGLFIALCGLFMSAMLGYECDVTPSDAELVMMYTIDEHGNGNYDVAICEGTNQEYINYLVYEDGKLHWSGTISRNYAMNRYAK